MNVIKTLAAFAAVGLGLVAWDRFAPEGGVAAAYQAIATPGDDAGGFVDIPMPDGLSPRGVVVFAPENCPSDAARRAEALAGHLRAQGIPHLRTSSAEYGNLASADEVSRVMAVMNGPIPIVYVNGRARANPTPEDVVAEFRRGKRG